MEEVHEECGLAGVYLKNVEKDKSDLYIIPELLYTMLFEQQKRGQLSAGFSTYNPFNELYETRLKHLREVGKVNDLYKANKEKERKSVIEIYRGVSGIGHVRYATSGNSKEYHTLLMEAQPFLRLHGRPWKRFSLAFNGNIANYKLLREEIENKGYILDTEVDTEIL